MVGMTQRMRKWIGIILKCAHTAWSLGKGMNTFPVQDCTQAAGIWDGYPNSDGSMSLNSPSFPQKPDAQPTNLSLIAPKIIINLFDPLINTYNFTTSTKSQKIVNRLSFALLPLLPFITKRRSIPHFKRYRFITEYLRSWWYILSQSMSWLHSFIIL